MRNLICSDIYKHAVIAGVLLMLPATAVMALKAPDNVMQQPSPVPSKPPKEADKRSQSTKEPRTAPARGSSSERVRADSAVSFPVDI